MSPSPILMFWSMLRTLYYPQSMIKQLPLNKTENWCFYLDGQK